MLLNKFRPVIGFEDLYLISPIGEIYIIKRRVIKKPYLTNGYLKTHLRKNGEYHSKYIHRYCRNFNLLIAFKFRGGAQCPALLKWITICLRRSIGRRFCLSHFEPF
jgi:hypothetical protein